MSAPCEIRGLTVRQPWAAAICHLGKDVENRTWAPPNYLIGGYLALHAGKTVEAEATSWLQDAIRFRTEPQLRLPENWNVQDHCTRGAVVAVARLAGVMQAATSPWFSGPFGWVLRDVVVLPNPIRCRGAQGLWRLQPETLVEVRAEWRRAQAA